MRVALSGRALRAAASIPLVFASGGLALRIFLHSAPLRFAPDLAQPVPVANGWHDFGSAVFLIFAAVVALAAVAYAVLLRELWSQTSATQSAGTLLAIAVSSAATLVVALQFPVIFSSDVYAYAAYGDLAAHHLNPYAHTLIPLRDSISAAAIVQWGNPPPVCVYGPLFVAIAKTVVTFANGDVVRSLFGLRAVAGFALVACGPLIFLVLRGRPISQRLAAAAGLTLNPIALWSAAEGHNDALMLAVVLLGFIAVRTAGPVLGAFVIACSALIKAPGLAAGVLLAAISWAQRERFVRVVLGLLGGMAVTALIALPFETGIMNVLVPHGHYAPQFSAQYLGGQVLSALVPWEQSAFDFGVAIAIVACVGLALYGLRLALGGRLEGIALAAFGLWLLIPNPYPWYALWILPVAFVSPNRNTALALLVASLTICLRYWPDAGGANNLELNLVVTVCEILIPIVFLLARSPVAAREAIGADSK